MLRWHLEVVMALSAFDDKASPPDPRSLEAMLGRTSGLWTRLTERLHAAYDPLDEDWGFAGKAYGWSLRLKGKKRALLYLTPCRGYFVASFALGEKACAAAHDRELPRGILDLIDAAPRYPEGRGVRIPVRTRKDVEHVERIAAIKTTRFE
jgi:Protein of unknown function (DUF3788)